MKLTCKPGHNTGKAEKHRQAGVHLGGRDKDGGGKYEFDINPFIREERLQMELYRKQAGEFGLSPRGRVGLSVASKDNDGSDLI